MTDRPAAVLGVVVFVLIMSLYNWIQSTLGAPASTWPPIIALAMASAGGLAVYIKARQV
jgi:hypothetical protein